ncbi:60S ribosomal export protein NMD3 [Schistosoma japonicum]|nr:60S ribosomal export protein NMD3 [Schistosoma japonicum]
MSKAYFSSPFLSITTQKHLSPFVVLEIEEQRDDSSQVVSSKKSYTTSTTSYPVGAKLSKKHSPVSVWVMKDPSNGTELTQLDNESDDGMIHTRSHLGRILHPGDRVLGLDLRNCNINNTEFEKLPEDKVPDIILVLRPSQSASTTGGKNNGPSKCKRVRKHSLNVADSECDTSCQAMDTNFSSSEDEYISFDEEDENETFELLNMDVNFAVFHNFVYVHKSSCKKIDAPLNKLQNPIFLSTFDKSFIVCKSIICIVIRKQSAFKVEHFPKIHQKNFQVDHICRQHKYYEDLLKKLYRILLL